MPRKEKFNCYRDDKLHVVKGMCKTCVYRPDSAVYQADVIKRAKKADTAVICHSTLGTTENAVCGGFFINDPTVVLKLAEAMGRIQYVEPPK
jgi:hypothetical protein